MTRFYVDTSAAAKLLVDEAESSALVEVVDAPDAELVATQLLATELMGLAQRHDVAQQAVTAVLDGIDLHDLPASLFREAGLWPGPVLRSLDTVHLVAAVRLGVDVVLTYDVRLSDAARQAGLTVASPGASRPT